MATIKIVTVILSLIVTGLGLTSQVRKNYSRKSIEGLSGFYFTILAVSYTFWSIYGFTQKDLVLIIPMTLGAVMSWVVVFQFFVYKKSTENIKVRGTIIENSLSDKSILKKVQITGTKLSGDWILHSVLVNENIIPELSRSLDKGPWYIHLWEQGKDDVIIVFKDKVFNIKFSDKSTWTETVAYGKSIGIPEKQLNFPID